MKKQYTIIILFVSFFNGYSQNSPLSVNSQTGQSVVNLTSTVGYGSLIKLQRSNNPTNYYSFETGAGSNDDLRLYVNNNWSSPLMSFKIDGKIGIGTASPAYKLDVAGPIRGNTMLLSQSNGNAQIYFYNNAAFGLGFRHSGWRSNSKF